MVVGLMLDLLQRCRIDPRTDQTLDDYEEQEESQNSCFVISVPVRDIMLFPKHTSATSSFVLNLTFRSFLSLLISRHFDPTQPATLKRGEQLHRCYRPSLVLSTEASIQHCNAEERRAIAQVLPPISCSLD
jgi:hypothetical protein